MLDLVTVNCTLSRLVDCLQILAQGGPIKLPLGFSYLISACGRLGGSLQFMPEAKAFRRNRLQFRSQTCCRPRGLSYADLAYAQKLVQMLGNQETPPSIADLALGCSFPVLPSIKDEEKAAIQSLAGLIVSNAKAIFPDVADEVLAQPLSPGTHKLLKLVRDNPFSTQKQQHAAEDLSQSALTLRGVYSLATGEEIGGYYPENVFTADLNAITLPLNVVPLLAKHGLGPPEFGQHTEDVPSLPLCGVLYGWNYRPMVTMIFEFEGVKIMLPVVLDTGGIQTLLNEESLKKLIPACDPYTWSEDKFVQVSVHGYSGAVYRAQGNAKGCNLVGKHWLRQVGAMLVVDYDGGGCMVVKATPVMRANLAPLPRPFKEG